MVNEQVRGQLESNITAAYSELYTLGVRPDKENLSRLTIDELESELDAVNYQIKCRKRFLASSNKSKKIIEMETKTVVENTFEIVAVYTDGGVIKKNPSPFGGTWAWCGVDKDGNRIVEKSGSVPATETRTVSNNHTEQIAIVKALEFLPDNWNGTVYSDSMVALGRVFDSWSERNLPKNISMRSKAAVARLGKIDRVLLQGHPTKADLECGIGKKRNLPVSIHNVWCDKACGLEAKKFIENLEIQEN